MKCIICEKDAQAICQFCGRAVCKEHIREQRFTSGYTSQFSTWTVKQNAVAVANAVWCGCCNLEFCATA